MRLYLSEDAACNFAAARAGPGVPGDLILVKWSATDGGAAGASMSTVACNGNHCTDGGPQEACLSDSVKMETDDDKAACTAKRHRDVELDSTDAHVGLNGLKRPKPTPLLCESALEEGAEWSEAEWAAFRKRLARETAAADATEASIRRSQGCCRLFADTHLRLAILHSHFVLRCGTCPWSQCLHFRECDCWYERYHLLTYLLTSTF